MSETNASEKLTGVILAAGEGTRAYPYTQRIPKAMLDVCGRPLIRFQLEILRDKMAVEHVVIVVSSAGGMIEDTLGNGEALGLKISYVLNDAVEKGPVYSLSMAEPEIKTGRFVAMLSDEIYLGSNHEGLLDERFKDDDIVLTARPDSLIRDIRKNFSLEFAGERISGLVEKPEVAENRLLGCGTYVFRKSIFARLHEALGRGGRNADNLTAFIASRIDDGDATGWLPLTGEYINVNYQHDVNRARSLARLALFPTPKVSLVLPCLASYPGLEDVVRSVVASEAVHETILAVAEETPEYRKIAEACGARLVPADVANAGLTPLIRAGSDAGTGDVVAVMSSDGTFEISDLDKLLSYIHDAEMVIGTRTARQLIDQGTNMNLLARLSNYFLAKFIEVLWVTHLVRISDVGCVYRVYWRYAYDTAISKVTSPKGEFLIDMVIEMLLHRFQLIELPVRYCAQTDEQTIRFQERNLSTFFRILKLALSKRLKSWIAG